ncbi:hypothetical protein CK203_108072 [Vitis vinifera]|uniref:Retrotransposon gag domain-containing protein n=1 Tax=Vitis vinifera TaxID=29760 RepID=A0A438DJF8_VITVI|nr:hypothetical protein CK203_108072 [Vitis vinifera]
MRYLPNSESHRSGGSGEGPQIGDSTGDRTQNLWFHKRIKLELELGLLIEIDLGSRAWIRIGDRLDYIVPLPPPPPPLVQSAPQARAFVLHGQTETTPHFVVAPTQIVDDTQARIDRIEQRMRSLHVSDGIMGWDGYDDMPVAALPVEFRMPDIERYMGIGCPRIHFGAAQRWFASLDPSRRRTWADLGQEFIRQYSFNTIVDISRRELEALRQGPDETVTSFIFCWREKIAHIIDRPSEHDQISMIMRSLQPRFARHLMGFPQTDFGSLVQALYALRMVYLEVYGQILPLQTQREEVGIKPQA